jgi:MoxR-like ATPase
MNQFNLYHNDTPKSALPNITLNDKLTDPTLYVPSKGLMAAVNVALHLGQPLLLTGEPGTGKTQLAHHLAYFFDLDKPLIFNAQTVSQAKDLFYRYDALAHFQFAQTQKEPLTPEEVERRFIRYHGLGKAIREDVKAVVLLDEIDKAPRDLPNDILAAIEELSFEVPEIGKVFKASAVNRPIIIMTSNSEKNLPDAFLRRVAYYNIPFPDKATLLRIVSAKIDGYTEGSLKKLIAHFEEIRSDKTVRMQKKPATAELINWVALLHKAGFDAEKIEGELTGQDRETLLMSYSVLAKNREDLKNIMKML